MYTANQIGGVSRILAENRDLIYRLALSSVFIAIIALPEAALADGTKIQCVLVNLKDWLVGPTGKAIATLAVIIVGVGALMGKVSWGMAIIVALGIGTVFGAPVLVHKISGNEAVTYGTCA